MNDMRPTILPKSDRQNADNFLTGPKTIKITRVVIDGDGEQPVAVSFDGDDGKPYYPCKTCRRVMSYVWGPDAGVYIGRSMTLFRDEAVTWGGQAVGGIRISHMSDINKPVSIALRASKANVRPYTVQPLRPPEKPKEAPRAAEKPKTPPSAPQPSTPSETTAAHPSDFADALEFDIDTATDADRLLTDFQAMVENKGGGPWSNAAWIEFSEADAARAAAIKAKAKAKVVAMRAAARAKETA